jgi:hypothetical protein
MSGGLTHDFSFLDVGTTCSKRAPDGFIPLVLLLFIKFFAPNAGLAAKLFSFQCKRLRKTRYTDHIFHDLDRALAIFRPF